MTDRPADIVECDSDIAGATLPRDTQDWRALVPWRRALDPAAAGG